MAKFPLDLSRFKKISATDKKTTLKHDDGHFLVIAQGKLKPDMQAALKGLAFAKGGKARGPLNPKLAEAYKMADGGEVAEPDPKKAKEMQSGATQSGWQPSQWGKNLKEGLGMADGGEVTTEAAQTSIGGPTTVGPHKPKITPEDTHNRADYMQAVHEDFMKKSQPEMSKGGKVERAKLFGEKGNPGKSSAKGKAQMIALIKTAARRYGLDVVPSQGKIEESGERRDFDPKQVGGKLKPDWRSNEMESQMNPQAISHEMAHLEISPEGKQLPTLQKDMDEGFADVASKFGGRQKQTQGEIQPMAMENPLRRRAGVPAFARPQYSDPTMGKGKEPITEESPERTALDTGEKYAQRLTDPETGEMYDLIGLSKNAAPANLERLMAVDEGSMKFGKGKGWHKTSTPDALINLRGRGQHEEAASRAQSMGIQKGKKPSRLLAEGGEPGDAPLEVEPISPEEQMTQSSAPMAQPEVEPMQPEQAAPTAPPPAPETPQEQAPQMPQQPPTPTAPRQASMSFEPAAVETQNNAPLAKRSVDAQMHAEDDAVSEDMATGQIHPKTYQELYANQDTLGKIGTMFGLLVGGLGSGLTGQPNAMLKMMDKTIERDLDAQKTGASNRQNFYKIRQQQFLNNAAVRYQNAQARTAELGNMATEGAFRDLGIIPGKNGKIQLSPAGERQVTGQAKMDMYNAASHDLESKLSRMSPTNPDGTPNPAYAATAGALQDLKTNIASQKQAIISGVAQAHQAEEDANDPVAKITGVSRSKVPAFSPVAPFLRDDAQRTYQGLAAAAATSPAMAAMTSGMKDQFTSAAQADKLLKALPTTYQDLYRLKSWTGRLSGLMANAGQAATTALGTAAGAKSGQPMLGAMAAGNMPVGDIIKTLMSGNQQERLYGMQVSKLAAMITNAVPALSGSVAGADEAKHWALQFAPMAGDTDSAVQYKMGQLVEKIKNAVPVNLLPKQMVN